MGCRKLEDIKVLPVNRIAMVIDDADGAPVSGGARERRVTR
jgi:hypothetical protein